MKYSSKSSIKFRIKAVMKNKRIDRKLKLSEYVTRCINKNQLHEFLIANDWNNDKNKLLNDISYIGFMECTECGVIEIGDTISDDKGIIVGTVIGFDYTHMPNHMNIVLKSASEETGKERNYKVNQEFEINGY